MSEHATGNPLTLHRFAPLGGLLAILGIATGLVMGGKSAMQSYVYGWLFMAGLVLGSLSLVILHNVLRATWTLSILRLIEAAASPLSIFMLFLGWIPIRLNMHSVYHWSDPAYVKGDHILENKAFFLNTFTFTWMSIAYFVFFMALSYFLRKSSLKQDGNLDSTEAQKRANVASPGLLIYVMICTLALTHWAMSLEPHWFSTVYPLLSMVGQVNCVVAICTIFLCANANRAPYAGVVTPKLTKDLGNILFATSMVWAYLTLSQFLIIWSGNLPEETPYFKIRAEHGWQFLGMTLIIGRFFLPFFALLAPKLKRSSKNLMRVAIWIVVMHFLDVFWLVVPGFERGGLVESFRISDFLILIGMVGLLLFSFATETKRAALVPTHDDRLTEANHGHA